MGERHDGAGEAGGEAAILTVDGAAIVANWRALAARAGPAECAAVLKADGYGLGAARVGALLARAGCRSFFVALLAEAEALRPYLPAEARLYVLNGLAAGDEGRCAALGAIPVINSLAALDRWRDEALRRGEPRPLALQFDTGMSRFGLSPDEVASLLAAPARAAGLAPDLLMSHLGCADTPDHPNNARQRVRFRDGFAALAAALGGGRPSLAASSGLFLPPDYHGDLVRPGAAIYGVPPVAGAPNPMQPVARLAGRCVQVRRIGAGETVGYGATFSAAAPMTIATIAVGYADGFLRAGSNRGAVAFGGRVLPIVGLVSMDSITVDASEAGMREGDTVELIGPDRPLADVARDAGTIGYEILTSLGRRYRRRYVGDAG